MGLTSCRRVTIAKTIAHRRRERAIGIIPAIVSLYYRVAVERAADRCALIGDGPSCLVKKPRIGQTIVSGNNGRAGRHDQERAPGNALKIAAATQNQTRDKIYDAGGIRVVHVFQVDNDRDLLAVVLTDRGGITKISRTHYRDLEGAIHGKLATGGFIVILNLTDAPGNIPVLVDSGAIVMLSQTEPIAGVASHYADLRRYEPIHGRRSGETMADT